MWTRKKNTLQPQSGIFTKSKISSIFRWWIEYTGVYDEIQNVFNFNGLGQLYRGLRTG